MSPSDNASIDHRFEERIEALEARVLRLERERGSPSQASESVSPPIPSGDDGKAVRSSDDALKAQDQLEFEVGHVWFAKVGIMALALGAGFALSLPYPGIPSFVPSFVVTAQEASRGGMPPEQLRLHDLSSRDAESPGPGQSIPVGD